MFRRTFTMLLGLVILLALFTVPAVGQTPAAPVGEPDADLAAPSCTPNNTIPDTYVHCEYTNPGTAEKSVYTEYSFSTVGGGCNNSWFMRVRVYLKNVTRTSAFVTKVAVRYHPYTQNVRGGEIYIFGKNNVLSTSDYSNVYPPGKDSLIGWTVNKTVSLSNQKFVVEKWSYGGHVYCRRIGKMVVVVL